MTAKTSTDFSAEQKSCLTWFDHKNRLCQLKRSTRVRPNDSGWHWIHTPTRSMTTISHWAGPCFTLGTQQLLSVGWFGAHLVSLQPFQCDGLSADGCWPRDSLSTERNNEVLSSRTLVAFLPNPPCMSQPLPESSTR